MTDYKGYDLFEGIESDLLRTWNRAETIFNISSSKGEDEAQAYMSHFDAEEQMKIKILLMTVSVNGRDVMYKKVQEHLNDSDFTDGED